MRLRFLLGCVCGVVAMWANAQSSGQNSVIYKWVENGVAHYASTLPHGVTHYSVLDTSGMVINKSEPAPAAEPVRPNNAANAENVAKIAPISAAQRCREAEQAIAKLRSKGPVYQEDANKNLIPLGDDERKAQLAQALQVQQETCNRAPTPAAN